MGDGIEPTDEQLGQIFLVLRRVSGIDFRQYKTPTVKRRLLRRMALHRLTGVDAYIRPSGTTARRPVPSTRIC
jgi:two-component system CheB/CheR fusion protein